MKIMMANKYFFWKGGAETVYFQERDFLRSAGVKVVDFSMYDERNEPSDFSDYFVEQRDYHASSLGALGKAKVALSMIHSPQAVARIKDLIRKEKPDLLHCHNIYHQLTPSIIRAAKEMGIRVVLTLHDFKVVCPTYSRIYKGKVCAACEGGDFYNVVRRRCSEDSLARSALLYAEATFERFCGNYLRIDRAIAPSRFMADVVTRWRFPKERVTVLYNGVDPNNFQPVPDSGGYALFLGRLIHDKGLLTLAEAQRGTDIRVVVAGTGPLEETLRRDYPWLELVGYQSGDALRTLVEGASFIVVPSLVQENCPMAVLEAMASGKAVIASRNGGIPELVEEGTTGLLFESGNADELRLKLQTLGSDTTLQAEMGRAARAKVQRDFSLQKHNESLLRIYESVLTERCV
ncbi:glycosyltransferase family 4 protein [Paraburkholderia sp.]|jgi:glycosyltransferase involved in cell wall biosynthesis|uniref:glycosyltransferase family 4 protein n=1 Tax=Paraburkholderia sp. TaxID=1926495 RepID=UPI003C42A9D4